MADEETRTSWASRCDFLLSCVGFCVGYGNVWRFSYLCYKNGGGAFLLPYLCCVVVVGCPILFLEIAMGQFTQQGAVGMWDLCPLMRGVGYSSMLCSALGCVYYCVILAWVGCYFVLSFFPSLPWTHCENDWNTDRCFVGTAAKLNQSAEYLGELASLALTNYTTTNHESAALSFQLEGYTNATTTRDFNVTATVTQQPVTSGHVHPAEELWWRRVLGLSEGIDTPGDVRLPLLLSLALSWLLVFFCVFKGVRWSGKVAYFTATFPYVLILVLLVRAALLEGSGTGVAYYIMPQFDRLTDIKVWFDAASQVLFSFAVALTVLPAYGSYCKFKSNCFRDAIIVSIFNSGTSILVGFVIFAMLGHMAHVQQQTIDKVATSGPGLAFIVYPQALSLLPVPQLWSVLFFFMMILVGIDSQFGCVEGILTCLADMYPRTFKWRLWILGAFVVSAFLLGLSMITEGGMYVFQLLDYYLFGAYMFQVLSILEVTSVGWIYGADRFYDDIESMIGYRINIWMKICWKFLTPVTLMVILIFNLATYQPLIYNRTYVYPVWANALGFLLSALVFLIIPLSILIILVRTPADTLLGRLRKATQSKLDRHSSEYTRAKQGSEMEAVENQQENLILSKLA